MGEAYWAAREGDKLLHTSMLADIVGAAVEMACYAAITAAVTAAATAAITATIGVTIATGGAAAIAISACAGIGVGVFMGLSGGSEVISDLADKISSIFPLSEDGKIKTGSHNTHINGLPAARAAAVNTP